MKRLTTLALALTILCSSVLYADLVPAQGASKGLFFGSSDPLEALFDTTYKGVTAQVPVPAGEGLNVEAIWKTPRQQVPVKEVTIDTIKSLRLLGHANVPIKILMVCSSTTKDEVQGMFEVIKQINESSNLPKEEKLKLQIIAGNRDALKGLQISDEDFKNYCEICPYFQTRDIWMQDWGEIGAVMVEGADKERMVVLDTKRGRGLAELPSILAKQWNGHYVKPDIENGPCGNYGGNIEVTPDDVLVIGNTSTQRLRDFFADAGYRDRMSVLETDWLVVGHVDEYLSTLCAPESELGYVIVKADPLLAMDLLKKVPQDQLEGRLQDMVKSFYKYFPINSRGYSSETPKIKNVIKLMGHLWEHLNGHQNEWTDDARAFAEVNEACAEIIDRNVEAMKAKLREVNGDIDIKVISFPTLLEQTRGYRGKHCAILPGVVNMVVLRDHLVIPDPLLKEYRDHIATVTAELNYTSHFVPNGSYHFLQGQLHCGSNTFRHPNRYIHRRYERSKRSRQFFATSGE